VSSILALGRTYNALVSVTTSARRISLRDCAGVGFFVVNASAATTLTINECNAPTGGTSQLLAGGVAATLTYWTQPAPGTAVWTAGAGGVNGTSINTIASTSALLYVFVAQGALSDGFNYLSASHATGTILYMAGDLDVMRKPVNLRDLTA
jgi:hypothetical protein